MRDRLHEPCAAAVWWSTVNASEAFPGVLTPLTWSWTTSPHEEFIRNAFSAIGSFRAGERAIPERLDLRVCRLVYGRVAINVNVMHTVTNRMPGAKADDFDAKFLAGEHFEFPHEGGWTRYPAVAGKLPLAAVRCRRALKSLGGETERWWRQCLDTPFRDRAEMLDRLSEASDRLVVVGVPHVVATMTMFAFYTVVGSLAKAAGAPGLEEVVMTTDGTEENRSVVDLWSVSRGTLSLDEFLDRHGFHGPAHELSDPAWREDDRAVKSLIQSFQGMADDASPKAQAAGRLLERAAAERHLLAGLGRTKRTIARFMIRHGREYIALRQLGRNTMLKAVDVARHACRAIGDDLVAEGILKDRSDVFYLSLDELRDPPPDVAELVEFRRGRRQEYQQLQLPDRWYGEAEVTALQAVDGAAGDVVAGIGVSAGVVEGIVRVVLDPYADHIEPGEILVCQTTDPSWASQFFVAAAVVIDVGGPLSHGAVVARELSLPCVINARNATRILRTGDRVRVDGTAGSVQVLT